MTVERGSNFREGPAGRLQIQHAVCDGEHTVMLTGELDLASATVLSTALAHICTDGTRAVVLDLRRLSFIDSTGIHAMLMTQALCAGHGCELRVLPGQAQVQRVFAICGLLDQLPFRDSSSSVSGSTAVR